MFVLVLRLFIIAQPIIHMSNGLWNLIFRSLQFNLDGVGSRAPIFVFQISRDPFTSILIINSNDVLNSTEVICTVGNKLMMNLAFKRIIGK